MDEVIVARVDTVTSASTYVLVGGVLLAHYIFTMKKMRQETKVIEISIAKPCISRYCLPPMQP